MSILVKQEIIKEYENKRLIISHYNEQNIGPNSVDVTLNAELLTYVPLYKDEALSQKYKTNYLINRADNGNVNDDVLLDIAKENKVYKTNIGEEGIVLIPGVLYLGCTNEEIGSDYYIPMYEGRSSMARLGIASHISAGFGDVGFKTQWTLEIVVIHPVIVYPNIRIGQVYFNKINEEELMEYNLYKGKYQDQKGVQASKSFKDF